MPVEERETSQNIDQTASEWVARMDRAPLSAVESHELKDWLAGDPRRRGAFIRARAVWMRSEAARALGPHYDPDDFQPAAVAASRPAPPSRRWMRWGGAMAASLLLVVTLAATLQMPTAYATAKGEMRRVPLGDGATVTLNTDTRIRIYQDDGRRTIRVLRGEVLIEGTTATSPTRVEVDGRKLDATQATFVVRKLDGDATQILVQDGRVDVAGGTPAEHASLAANTRYAFRQGTPQAWRLSSLRTGQMDRELAWREGKIALQGETLGEAVAIYARYSDTPIVIADPALARMQVTGLFATNNPLGFSRAIAEVFDAEVRQERGRIVVARAH
ncbi:FecR domain-containing protein [Pseudoxanthomonas sp. PXM04]|uniref:FecR family protein n=1 Tax=Pseudoxanthomonas sp. PXM04 TaxID=2769297 RepID=UPI0031BB1EC3